MKKHIIPILLLLAVAAYAKSLFLTAISENDGIESLMTGYFLIFLVLDFSVGGFGALGMLLAWLSNFLVLLVIILMFTRFCRLAHRISFAALAFSLLPLFYIGATIGKSEFSFKIESLGAGYFLWVTSLILVAIAANLKYKEFKKEKLLVKIRQ